MIKMKTQARFHISTDGISLGDHVISFTPEGTRHGIYVGFCQVISVKSGVVTAESFEEFTGGNPLHVYLQKSDFSAAEIARRAKSRLGTMLEPWNDHFFCEWCLRGLVLV